MRIMHVGLKTHAFLVAGHLREVGVHCTSVNNPADKVSRDPVAWHKYRHPHPEPSQIWALAGQRRGPTCDQWCGSPGRRSPETRRSARVAG